MDNETREMFALILKGQDELKQEISEVKATATRTAVLQENEIAGKIQLIYENQLSIIESNHRLDKQDERIDVVETDVFTLKHAFDSLKKTTV